MVISRIKNTYPMEAWGVDKVRGNEKSPYQGTEKLFPKGVILSVAKDLLFASVESKADPSVVQHRLLPQQANDGLVGDPGGTTSERHF
jgi:hypothetical protein